MDDLALDRSHRLELLALSGLAHAVSDSAATAPSATRRTRILSDIVLLQGLLRTGSRASPRQVPACGEFSPTPYGSVP